MIAVRKSKINGKGVFATRLIPKNKLIIEYDGERISRKEGLRRDKIQKKQGKFFVFAIDGKWCVDGASGGIARLINHSCDPNCKYVRKNGKIWIKSMRAIKKGEELTYDYDIAEKGKYPCKCKSFNCNGTM